MKIIEGVRYADEDVKEFKLTGGRDAREGDVKFDRTTHAAAVKGTRSKRTPAKPGPLNTTDTNPQTDTDQADGQDETGTTEAQGDQPAPAPRKAR